MPGMPRVLWSYHDFIVGSVKRDFLPGAARAILDRR